MVRNLITTLFAISLAGLHGAALAEDIDLFAIKDVNAGTPNVLIILDNSANWSTSLSVPNCYYKENGVVTTDGPKFDNPNKEQGTKMAVEKCALYNLIDALPTHANGDARFNIGLMLFNQPGADSGGYPHKHFTPLTTANKAALKAIIRNITIINGPGQDQGSNAAFAKAMHEAYLYFKGELPHVGNDGTKFDSAAFAADGKYNSPVTSDCGRNFIIFIANGSPGESTDGQARALLEGAAGATVSQITYPFSYVSNSDQGNWADEYARFLNNTDINPSLTGTQSVTTYAVAVTGHSSDGLYPNFMDSMAVHGGGGSVYRANNVDALVEALLRIFSEIQSVDSAFASASLPVSVNTQGTYLNQVFIGMFRPDPSPRWFGNLKQYQFRADADSEGNVVRLRLVDKMNEPVINPNDGFISPCARSFWSIEDNYWPSGYLGGCFESNVRSNSPDGEVVEKGGAAQRLRTQLSALSGVGSRPVKTSDGSGLIDFGTSSGLDSTLVNWVRGANNKTPADEPAVTPSTIRPSVIGDVVHSRPLAIDYGGTTGVVVFYGSNDGMLRAVNGNKDVGDNADANAGKELWSFVAPEHYDRLERLRNNSPAVNFPGVIGEKAPKDYFFDGSIGAYRSGNNVWIYPTMRRGGSHVYAFNVSSPAAPTLKWKRGPLELENVGQTWSEPKVVKVAGYPIDNSVKKPIVIMGGGYDPCEDNQVVPNTTCGSTSGNRVFVIDADDGTVLKTLVGVGEHAIRRSIAADITAVDSDGDGYVDVAYAVDTGANIYRINIGTAEPVNWSVKRIASLGCPATDGVVNLAASCDRKFLHAPEVVIGYGYNAVLVGSGNREQPLINNPATAVSNAFFMIKDDRSTDPALVEIGHLFPIIPDQALTETQKTELDAKKGWFLQFGSGAHAREQVVTSAAVVAGVVYFSTHTPTEPPLCGADRGKARGYSVVFTDASATTGVARFREFIGGGLPPSPVPGVVSLALTDGDGSPLTNADGSPVTANVPFVIGGGGLSGLDPTLVPVNPSAVRSRVYWYIEQ